MPHVWPFPCPPSPSGCPAGLTPYPRALPPTPGPAAAYPNGHHLLHSAVPPAEQEEHQGCDIPGKASTPKRKLLPVPG